MFIELPLVFYLLLLIFLVLWDGFAFFSEIYVIAIVAVFYYKFAKIF